MCHAMTRVGRRVRRTRASLLVAFAVSLSVGCHHGGSGAVAPAAIEMVALVPDVERRLDDPVVLLWNEPVDAASVDATTVRILGVAGPGVGTEPAGAFVVTSLGDGSFADRTVVWTPRLPPAPDAAVALLQADTTYAMTLVEGGVRSRAGGALDRELRLSFRTARASAPGDLYSGGPAGGPRATSVRATATDGDGNALLGRFGDPAVALRVAFDQPIDPGTDNVPPASTHTTPGPLQLRYADPERGDTAIEFDVEFARNERDGAELLLWPRGVLPNAAEVQLWRRGPLRDLAGEVDEATPPALVGAVHTAEVFRPLGDAARFGFDREPGDTEFAEPVASVRDDELRPAALFPDDDQPGAPLGDWTPRTSEIVLDTAEHEFVYDDGRVRTVRGGVFRVRDLVIPAGVLVRGRGPNPLVFVVEGSARIDGEISVRGFDAQQNPLSSFRGPGDSTPGGGGFGGAGSAWIGAGRGNCGGGAGGEGGFRDRLQTPGPPSGEAGQGPGALAGGGGAPGLLPGDGCTVGSGGGGGSFATQGDPGFPTPASAGFGFPQRAGDGGRGCSGVSGALSRSLPGGSAGPSAFADGRADNDFYGDGFDPRRGRRIRGELTRLRGGSGGGGGGNGPGQVSRFGGGGGGGGGGIVLQVRHRLVIGPAGRVCADGGHGIGGDQGASSNTGGGGGGGSGGMVVLMAGDRIVLHQHGGTFAERDYDFCVSADGGICRTGTLLAPFVQRKYPANGQSTVDGGGYDARPLGGFGGLGLIQLMAPIGSDNDDGTNTVLDDAIDVVQGGVLLTGSAKIRALAWRGLAGDDSEFVDDFGNPTGFAFGEGDLRPSPVLLPVPYGPRSRARSAWLPLGVVDRRPLAAPDGGARAVVVEPGTSVGPDFAHATESDGRLPLVTRGGAFALERRPLLPAPLPVRSSAADVRVGDDPVYALELATPLPLSTAPDRYAGHLAELRAGDGRVLAAMRIRGHDLDTILLVPQLPLPDGVASVQVVAGLLDLGSMPAGMPAYLGADGGPRPVANVQLGFAFHRRPASALAIGDDPDRFPAAVGAFVRDLDDPAVRDQLRAFGATHVQWDLLFDREFRRLPVDRPPVADPALVLAVRGIWLPFRF